MHRIRIGLSSWTDKSLIEESSFYPPEVKDAESRLRFYASHFPHLVEVNSTYYGLPSERNSRLWSQRTPDDFLFDVKLFSLLTQHPTAPRSLPSDLLSELDEETRSKRYIYLNHVPAEMAGELAGRFVAALRPLAAAGKLGAILAQFPPWFPPEKRSLAHIDWLREHLGEYRLAVEFRHAGWTDQDHLEGTLDFLRGRDLTYVCVDEPQGYVSSVPPIAVATSQALAYVRFHGRRTEMWEKKGVSVQERTKYLYTEAELAEWAGRIRSLAEQVEEVHVLMNTNYSDYAVRNARQLRLLLAQTPEVCQTSGVCVEDYP